jgi:restriction endonuclease S subunit
MTGATVGKVAISNSDNLFLNQRVGLIRAKGSIMQEFIKWLLLSDSFYEYAQQTAGGGAQGNISPVQILKYEVLLPSLEVQKQIVSKIEEEQKAVDACKKLIELNKQKIKSKISEAWGERKQA